MDDEAISRLIRKTVHETASSPAMQAVIEKTATRSANKAITQSFLVLGIDVKNPTEVQADAQFVRYMRKTVQGGIGKGMIASVGLVATTFLGGVIFLFQDWLRKKGLI